MQFVTHQSGARAGPAVPLATSSVQAAASRRARGGDSACLSGHAHMLERSGIVASGLDPDVAGGHVDRRVHDTIATMENQLHRRLTIPELAAAVGLSAAHLTR